MNERKDLAGRSFLVTGANTGIGRATAVALAKRGASLVLAGRSEERTKPVVDEIAALGAKVSFLALDLGDLTQVASAAKTFLDRGEPLDVLVNNAGIGKVNGLTKDGFELITGTNHLGPFLFTKLLLPLLQKKAGSRVVMVSSGMHRRIKKASDLMWDSIRKPTAHYTGLPEYAFSKLCNIWTANELARAHGGPNVRAYSLHPGAVASDIYRDVPQPFRWLMMLTMISNEEGALTSIHCAASPEAAEENGLFYDKCKPVRPSALAEDEALAKDMWTRSEELVAPFAK